MDLQTRTFLMLLATLVAIVTFRAGLSPPMGFWRDSRDGHLARESVFLSTHPNSFRFFMVCDWLCFFTSLAMLLCLVCERLHNTQKKMTALAIIAMLDLCLLVCAFFFATCPEHPLQALWYLLYGAIICGTVFLAVYFHYSALSTDEGKQPRKRAKTDEGKHIAMKDG